MRLARQRQPARVPPPLQERKRAGARDPAPLVLSTRATSVSGRERVAVAVPRVNDASSAGRRNRAATSLIRKNSWSRRRDLIDVHRTMGGRWKPAFEFE